MTLNTYSTNTNVYPNAKVLDVDRVFLYPSGYLNLDQYGNYTKHYYADEQRIASKIGSGCSDDILSNLGYVYNPFSDIMQKELSELVPEDTVTDINYSFEPITHLIGDSNKYENALFWYHGDHLSSTAIVTDIDANVTKAALYLPFGTPLSIYNSHWELDTVLPQFLFQNAEYDEENRSYLMGLRYLSIDDWIFRGRDKMFEKFFWQSPYCAVANNPLKYVDPTGTEFDETQDKKYIQPMEKDIQTKIDGLKKQMDGLTEGSDEYNRLDAHAKELGNALTEISALRSDTKNLYMVTSKNSINFL